jgi:ATP-binding cassette subfamily B protein
MLGLFSLESGEEGAFLESFFAKKHQKPAKKSAQWGKLIKGNLYVDNTDASDKQIEAVVEAAQLRDLVERLPQGLATIVGERGYRLSGGEKQRVAIARALLCQAPYLLLDEATSSLDSQAERRIQAALETLVRGRTVIAIAHRLSTIQRADQILVIQQGRIVECGTHETLLRQSGLYQSLYIAQFAPDAERETENMGENEEHNTKYSDLV